MPTTRIVSGISATIKSHNIDGDLTKIQGLKSFQLLHDRCQAPDLDLAISDVNPSGELIIMIGKCIYCEDLPRSGLVINHADDLTAEQRSASEAIFIDLMTLLLKAGFSPAVRRGLVVSQFR